MPETRAEILRRLRHAKDSERRLGKYLLEHDGPHPLFRPGNGIATKTGRVGHITALQFDVASRSYAAENKNMKVPAVLWKAWVQVVQVARREGLEPLLRIEPTNEQTSPPTPNLIVVAEERHAYLLKCERELLAIQSSPDVTVTPLRDGQLPPGLKRVPALGYSKDKQLGKKPK